MTIFFCTHFEIIYNIVNEFMHLCKVLDCDFEIYDAFLLRILFHLHVCYKDQCHFG